MKRKVINVTTGKIYPSIKEAAADVGCNPKGIYNVLVGYCNTAGGFEWRYADGKF